MSAAARPLEILYVLDTDRESHQTVGDAELHPILRWHGCVCHGGRMTHQAFDATQTFRQREDPQRFHEAPRRLERPEIDGDDSAETARLPACQLVLRMLRANRV